MYIGQLVHWNAFNNECIPVLVFAIHADLTTDLIPIQPGLHRMSHVPEGKAFNCDGTWHPARGCSRSGEVGKELDG